MKGYLITTEHRGVFFGFLSPDADLTNKTLTDIKDARMAIYWRNGKGVMGLADDGPEGECKIGSPANIAALHDVTAVFECTERAVKAWTGE